MDGLRNRRNKVAFSNFSSAVKTGSQLHVLLSDGLAKLLTFKKQSTDYLIFLNLKYRFWLSCSFIFCLSTGEYILLRQTKKCVYFMRSSTYKVRKALNFIMFAREESLKMRAKTGDLKMARCYQNKIPAKLGFKFII